MTRLAYALIGVLLLSGCNPKEPYVVEREYYYLQRKARDIFTNLESTPPNQLERVVEKFRAFSKKHPTTNLSIDAEFTIARLYLAKKEYSQCRTQLNQIMKKFHASKMISSEALFLIGVSYEQEGKWASALNRYNKVIETYPLTKRGLNMPLYIALHYKAKYEPDKMIMAYQEAIVHYKGLARKYPRTKLAFFTQMLAVDCYAAMKDWQNAASTIDELIRMFKGRIPLERVYITKAMIYKNGMKDDARAAQTLEQLLLDFPKSPFVEPVKKALKELRTQ